MRSAFLRGAAVIAIGGLVAKAVGALYRIPLANLLGGYGMGLYQMAYPLFLLFLTLSSAGIPSALSRIVAEEQARGESSRDTLRSALALFFGLGFAATCLMCLIAPVMSAMQGELGLTLLYLPLAPSVTLVALIGVFRGYYQGLGRMLPTALSELIEAAGKVGCGLLLAGLFRTSPVKAAGSALFAVTLSEAAALLFLVLCKRESARTRGRDPGKRNLLASVLPVMASAAVLPLSQTLDSIVIVRLLAGRTAENVALYGLFSGGALALVNLPATVSYGFAAASIPAVSSAVSRGEEGEARHRSMVSLGLTLLVAVPGALGLFLFARPIVSLLYGGLGEGDAALLVRLVRLTSVSAVSLAGVNTLAACLTGMGRAKKAACSMTVAVIAKLSLELALIGPRLGIGGAAIAANACYLIAFFLDLVYTLRKTKEAAYDHGGKSRNKAGGTDPPGEEGTGGGGRGVRADGRRALRRDA